MTMQKLVGDKPGLLVSVRSAAEALTALAGGADVIDVKEPSRGPLGAADDDTISAIVRSVAGRAPVTAAMGELVELLDRPNRHSHPLVVRGVSLFKIGLAGCAPVGDWQIHWRRGIESISTSGGNTGARPVAVAYADWRAAESPPPLEVLQAAVEAHCPALLVDTWGKSGGSLFDHWPVDNVRSFIAAARRHPLTIVLAGSLAGASIAAAARLSPNLVAVRAAACDAGREGTISKDRVREVKQIIAAAMRTTAASFD